MLKIYFKINFVIKIGYYNVYIFVMDVLILIGHFIQWWMVLALTVGTTSAYYLHVLFTNQYLFLKVCSIILNFNALRGEFIWTTDCHPNHLKC